MHRENTTTKIQKKQIFFVLGLLSLQFMVLATFLMVSSPSSQNYSPSVWGSGEITPREPNQAAPEDPVITLIMPTNHSNVTSEENFVTFIVDITPGLGANMTDRYPTISFDQISYFPFDEISNEAWERFQYDWDISGLHGQWFPAIEINCTNNLTRTNSIYINLTVDLVNPVIHEVIPAQDQILTTDTTLQVNATDADSGVDEVRLDIEYLQDPDQANDDLYVPFNPATGYYEYEWNILSNKDQWLPGLYTLTFTAYDTAGNKVEETRDLVVDYDAPSLLFLNPTNNSDIAGEVTFEVFARDPTAGIDQVTFQITGGSQVAMSPVTPANPSNPAVYFTYTLNTESMSEDAVSVIVRAYDNGGLVNTTWGLFTIDNTLPEAILTGNVSWSGTANFSLNCSDTRSLGRVAWRIDNHPFVTLPVSAIQTFTFSTKNYADGNHTLAVLVEDDAGNQVIVSQYIVIDNTPPQVAARNLQDGLLIDKDFVLEVWVYDTTSRNNLSFYYSLNQADWVQVNRSELDSEGVYYLALGNLALKSGNNNITLRAYDLGQGYDEDTYFFLYNKPSEYDYWWILYLTLSAGLLVGVGFLVKKCRATHKTYKERVDKEIKRVEEQKGIETKIEEEVGKIDVMGEGGLFGKKDKPDE